MNKEVSRGQSKVYADCSAFALNPRNWHQNPRRDTITFAFLDCTNTSLQYEWTKEATKVRTPIGALYWLPFWYSHFSQRAIRCTRTCEGDNSLSGDGCQVLMSSWGEWWRQLCVAMDVIYAAKRRCWYWNDAWYSMSSPRPPPTGDAPDEWLKWLSSFGTRLLVPHT